jgi:hypothetical protein
MLSEESPGSEYCVMSKPVSFSEFVTAMNAIGMFWLHLNEVAAN